MIVTRDKYTIIRKHTDISPLSHIFYHQRDVAYSMVLTLASGTNNCKTLYTLLHQVAHSFTQVVGGLLILLVPDTGILQLQFFGQGIAISDYGSGSATFGNKSLGSTVATYNRMGFG
jgi:hypothetical protein